MKHDSIHRIIFLNKRLSPSFHVQVFFSQKDCLRASNLFESNNFSRLQMLEERENFESSNCLCFSENLSDSQFYFKLSNSNLHAFRGPTADSKRDLCRYWQKVDAEFYIEISSCREQLSQEKLTWSASMFFWASFRCRESLVESSLTHSSLTAARSLRTASLSCCRDLIWFSRLAIAEDCFDSCDSYCMVPSWNYNNTFTSSCTQGSLSSNQVRICRLFPKEGGLTVSN